MFIQTLLEWLRVAIRVLHVVKQDFSICSEIVYNRIYKRQIKDDADDYSDVDMEKRNNLTYINYITD